MSVKKASKVCVFSYVILFAAAMILFLFFMMSSRSRSLASELCEYRSREVLNRIINESAAEALAQSEGVLYSFTTDSSGNITAYGADQAAVNAFKTRLMSAVDRRIAELGPETVYITLGDIMGSAFLSGRGPSFSVEYTPAAAASAELELNFEEAGINQTRVTALLTVKAEIAAVFPFGKETLEVTSQQLIADEMIVGSVPEFYSKK